MISFTAPHRPDANKSHIFLSPPNPSPELRTWFSSCPQDVPALQEQLKVNVSRTKFYLPLPNTNAFPLLGSEGSFTAAGKVRLWCQTNPRPHCQETPTRCTAVQRWASLSLDFYHSRMATPSLRHRVVLKTQSNNTVDSLAQCQAYCFGLQENSTFIILHASKFNLHVSNPLTWKTQSCFHFWWSLHTLCIQTGPTSVNSALPAPHLGPSPSSPLFLPSLRPSL